MFPDELQALLAKILLLVFAVSIFCLSRANTDKIAQIAGLDSPLKIIEKTYISKF